MVDFSRQMSKDQVMMDGMRSGAIRNFPVPRPEGEIPEFWFKRMLKLGSARLIAFTVAELQLPLIVQLPGMSQSYNIPNLVLPGAVALG